MREGPFRRSRLRLLLLSVAAIAAVAAILPAAASAEKNAREQSKAFFDSRQAPTAKNILKGREAKLAAEPSAAVVALRDQLGVQGIVAVDPLTSTPRIVA